MLKYSIIEHWLICIKFWKCHYTFYMNLPAGSWNMILEYIYIYNGTIPPQFFKTLGNGPPGESLSFLIVNEVTFSCFTILNCFLMNNNETPKRTLIVRLKHTWRCLRNAYPFAGHNSSVQFVIPPSPRSSSSCPSNSEVLH